MSNCKLISVSNFQGQMLAGVLATVFATVFATVLATVVATIAPGLRAQAVTGAAPPKMTEVEKLAAIGERSFQDKAVLNPIKDSQVTGDAKYAGELPLQLREAKIDRWIAVPRVRK